MKLNSGIFKKALIFTVILTLAGSHTARALTDKIYNEISTFSDGMLTTLDPHTVYFPAEVYKNFSSDTKGRFGGVGIEVSIRDGVLTVISPIEGTPAWDAGIKSGDKIVAIDGKSTKNMSLGSAVRLMRGTIGRKLIISIWREGHRKSRTITIVRKLIKVPGVKSERFDDGILLTRIATFQEGITKNLKKMIDDYTAENELNGLILDLRDNPGGLLSESIKVSDLFLKKGVIVSTKGRNQPLEVKKARSKGTLPNVPVVVLINKGSASASEIVAGALQDHGRAKLMGIKSFGKGSVQTIVGLNNGGAVKITIAHYFTPKDRLIDGKGISPDVTLDLKGYKKKNKIEDDEKIDKITREDFYDYQKSEALKYIRSLI